MLDEKQVSIFCKYARLCIQKFKPLGQPSYKIFSTKHAYMRHFTKNNYPTIKNTYHL